MSKFVAILISILIATSAIASDEYDVNWQLLESTFNEYLNNPNKENANKIKLLLPVGMRASHKTESYNVVVAIKILNRLSEIEKLVTSGNVNALDVAFSLSEISDGEYSEWIATITASAIIRHPKEYLTGIKERWMYRPNPCLSSAVLHWNFEGDHVSVLNERRASIKTVSDRELESQKKCVLDTLDKYISEPPLQ